MRIAFLADIHGNLPALKAVLGDLENIQPDRVYLLGDQINRCPWSREVLDLCQEKGWPAIQGNHEEVVARFNHYGPDEMRRYGQRYPASAWTWRHLRPEQRRLIEELPKEMSLSLEGLPAMRLVHGVPGSASVGIYPESTDQEIAPFLDGVSEPILVCGHTHRPLIRMCCSRRIWNGGSVGMPYNGDPRAQYLLVESTPEGQEWRPILRRVDYDRSGIARAFKESGMLDEVGKVAELFLRTVLTGEPWASDFAHWMKYHSNHHWESYDEAVQYYLRDHGPGQWAFLEEIK